MPATLIFISIGTKSLEFQIYSKVTPSAVRMRLPLVVQFCTLLLKPIVLST
jgi:hypothetical protein